MNPDKMHAGASRAANAAPDSAPKSPRRAKIWVVRADGGKYTDHFIAGGYAAVGWFDLSSASNRDEIRRLYERQYPDALPGQIANETGQLTAFRLDMTEGDFVITPGADRESLHYGRVTGACVAVAEDDSCDHRNRRTVDWAEETLNRSSLTESLQRTLATKRTVFRVAQREEFLAAIGVSDSSVAAGDVRSTRGTDDHDDDPAEQRPLVDEVGAANRRDDAGTESGVEAEREDPEEGATEQPFDPSKIKVRTVNVVVDQIVSRITHGEIDLQPDFQRVRGIWDAQRRSRLIESLLLRIPIPVFYVAADHDEKWAVVDGVQRISTIHGYMAGEFALTRLEYRQEFDGKRYGELPRPMRRRISETQLVVNVIEPGTPPEVMFNIFSRINTGGMTLNGQEIRHALNPGPVREYLKALAESDEFLDATDRSIRPLRMADRECVLRFLAFYIEPWEQYAAGSLDRYLEKMMKTINGMAPTRLDALADDFRKAMRAAARIFGNDAFRKRYHSEDGRYQISLALFETWAVQLARCSPEQIDELVARHVNVRSRFMALLNEDSEFEKAISVSTGTPQRIRKRFTAIRDLVQEVL